MFNFISPILANLFQKIILRYAILFSLLLSINNSLAYEYIVSPELKFESITIQDGLSQSYVFDIVEDKQGLIWIATQEGLNKYDGKDFTHYKNDILDKTSVANNFIRKVFVDNSGRLWIGTQNGLSRYNEKTDNFDNYLHNKNTTTSLQDNVVWDIYQDRDNKIWITTESGIHYYDENQNNFHRIKIKDDDNKLKEIKIFFQDEQGNFWLGTYENGIYIVGNNLKTAISLQKENKWSLYIDANRLSDIAIVDNDYWLATDKGIFIVDKNYKLKRHLDSQSVNAPISSNMVNSILQIDDTHVWIATEFGLTIYNLHHQNTVHHKVRESKNSIINNYIYKLHKSSSDTIWICTDGGINTFSSISMSFKHFKFDDDSKNQILDFFIELPDKQKILARGDGQLFSLRGQEQTKLPIKFDGSIHHIINKSSDVIIVRTIDNDLFEYNLNTNELINHKNWVKNSNYPHETNIILFINNKLWFINNENNLSSYDLSSEQFNSYQDHSTKITSLFFDEGNDNDFIWATSLDNKIVKFSFLNKTFETIYNIKSTDYLISNSKHIIKSGDWFWLGSFDQGILLFNAQTGETHVFNENNKLANNSINGLFVDEDLNAWFSTNKGISAINPFKKTVMNFGESFGVNDNEFINGSILYSSEKVAYFGGLNGFHRAKLSEVLAIEQSTNKPILTNLLLANKKINVLAQSGNADTSPIFTLNNHINNLKNLTLQHEQSPFSIEFISPNVKIPNQIKYKYRLQGLEEDWIETDTNNRRATYTNLDAGSYIFEVQAIDSITPSNSKTKTLKLTIMPPWWLSTLALTLYALVILLIVGYFLFQLRQQRLSHLQIQLSEERLKLSLWGSGDEMWDWNIVNGKIFRSNIWGILEFPQDGKRNVGAEQTNIHQHDIPRVRSALNAHFTDEVDHFEATYRVKDKNNRWIWVLDRGKIVERDEKNSPTRMTGTLKDISQIKRTDERLKLFAKCIENISDAVVIFDRQFTIVDVNKAYQRITQIKKSDMLGTSLRFKQYSESFTQNIKKHLITQGSWHGEIEDKHINGDIYTIDLNIDIIKDENNNISHFVGVFSDVTERKNNEIELRKLANSDTLTGLPNRSYFQANQTRLVKAKTPHALLVFDLDNFKKINDSMGHGVGDALLCKVAQRIIASGRKQDTVYRLGGDEFSIIVENTNDIHTITTIAKNTLKTVAQAMKLKNQEVVLYSSIGIVLFPEDGASSQELLKNADTAMYHAKNSGGNKYQFFNESMNKKAVKRLQIENLMRHGLKEDYFSVFYQPKIEISTGKVAGMEALVRFETPSKGIISPVVFIPVSEETGQIIDIGEIVLRKSCFATKKWVDAGLFEGRIAVNLSAVQFTQPNLVGMISDILKESGLPAKYLELEITEGTVMDSPQQAIDTMLQIRAMGIHLSLDDFGTGYSSLAYLKKFPLNTLKIDKAFVDDIETSEQGRNMVATIVTIAHNLGLHVVAEGVETNQQLNFLSGLHCEQLQGYLYSKPLPENDFQKYLLSHQITNKSTEFNRR